MNPITSGKYAVPTHHNTPFVKWWGMADAEFKRLNLPPPRMEDAEAAYQMGESPQTWAEQVQCEE